MNQLIAHNVVCAHVILLDCTMPKTWLFCLRQYNFISYYWISETQMQKATTTHHTKSQEFTFR